MMMRKCSVCNEDINPKRLEILPNTQTCVQHSTVEKKVAVTSDTKPETVFIDEDINEWDAVLLDGLDDEDEFEEEQDLDDITGE